MIKRKTSTNSHEKKPTFIDHDYKHDYIATTSSNISLLTVGSDCIFEIFKYYIKSSNDILRLSHICANFKELINSNTQIWNCKINSRINRALYFEILTVNRVDVLNQFLLDSNFEQLPPPQIEIDKFSKKNRGHFKNMISNTNDLMKYLEYEKQVEDDFISRSAFYSYLKVIFEWIQRLFIILYCIWISFQEHYVVMTTAFYLNIYSWIKYIDLIVYISLILEIIFLSIDIFVVNYYSQFVKQFRKSIISTFKSLKCELFDTYRSKSITLISMMTFFLIFIRVLMYFANDGTDPMVQLENRRKYFNELDLESATLIQRVQATFFNGEETFRFLVDKLNVLLSIPLAFAYYHISIFVIGFNTLFVFGLCIYFQFLTMIFFTTVLTPILGFVITLLGGYFYWNNISNWKKITSIAVSHLLTYLGFSPFYIFLPHAIYFATCSNSGNWISDIDF